MAWKEYKYYAQFGPRNEMVYRPVVGLKVSNDGKTWHEFSALIDSGCDITMLDAEIAELLGIDKTTCPKLPIGGVVGNTVEAFCTKIFFKIEGFDELFETEVRFVPNMKFSALLGHTDFFELFKVKFEKMNKRFYLSK